MGARAAYVISVVMILAGCMARPTSVTKSVEATVSVPRQLSVVQTWGELASQPKQDAGDGISVRLAIGATHAPRNYGTFIYCLTDGYDAVNDLAPISFHPDRIGPLWVSIRRDGESLDHHFEPMDVMGNGGYSTRGCTLCFCFAVLIDRAGTYHVTVRTPSGKNLAEADVVADDEFYQPWTPFELRKEADWEWISRSDYTFRQTSLAEVFAPGIGIALPGRSGRQFDVYAGNARLGRWFRQEAAIPIDPMRSLPTIVPREPDPGLHLSVQSSGLMTLESSGGDSHERFYPCRPDLYLLARWWVNGKPFVPRAGHAEELFGDVPMHPNTSYQIHLSPDLSCIGARRGDRIGLQLVQCDHWYYVENSKSRDDGGSVRLTNKVEFVAE